MRTLLIIFVVVAVIVFVLGLGYMLLLFQRTRKLRQDKDPQLIRAERIEKRAQDRYKDEVRAQLFTSALNDPNRWGKRTISDMSNNINAKVAAKNSDWWRIRAANRKKPKPPLPKPRKPLFSPSSSVSSESFSLP